MTKKWYVIINKPNGTIKAIGPLADYREACAYRDFVSLPDRMVNCKDTYDIVREMWDVNRWGAPVYPFMTGED